MGGFTEIMTFDEYVENLEGLDAIPGDVDVAEMYDYYCADCFW